MSALSSASHMTPVVDVLCRWGQEAKVLDTACDVLRSFMAASAAPAAAADDDFQPAGGRKKGKAAVKRGRDGASTGPTAGTCEVTVDPAWAMNPVVAVRCIDAVFAGNPGGARDRLLTSDGADAGSGPRKVRGSDSPHPSVLRVMDTLTLCRDELVRGVSSTDSPLAMAQAAVSAMATHTLVKLHLHVAGARSVDFLTTSEGLKAMMVRSNASCV